MYVCMFLVKSSCGHGTKAVKTKPDTVTYMFNRVCSKYNILHLFKLFTLILGDRFMKVHDFFSEFHLKYVPADMYCICIYIHKTCLN